ncbi:MAG: type II toxin-antitoxin system RelE/ParE family toxin [Faecalibacterium sp.]|nr:type II toxin-antitoxin system RelE/ParE family toxin [Ruminococcus sp.]MCM1391394.1 type II toxin-antitoxin system RelE/ParE family toxin [Ruminococcus sp.]MCM1484604.1 type II toxin-antitoxin system RelE/ParE family toxin [Faecalibacterium sp.]
MIFDIKYTQRSIGDLDNIYEYISKVLEEPNIAVSIVNLIRSEIRKLNEMPMRFRLYDNEPWHSRGLRCFNVKKYMIFYLPCEENKTVHIVSIMYGGRNIQDQLNDIKLE